MGRKRKRKKNSRKRTALYSAKTKTKSAELTRTRHVSKIEAERALKRWELSIFAKLQAHREDYTELCNRVVHVYQTTRKYNQELLLPSEFKKAELAWARAHPRQLNASKAFYSYTERAYPSLLYAMHIDKMRGADMYVTLLWDSLGALFGCTGAGAEIYFLSWCCIQNTVFRDTVVSPMLRTQNSDSLALRVVKKEMRGWFLSSS